MFRHSIFNPEDKLSELRKENLMCCVCFNEEYKQNDNFVCNHPLSPLCQDCYNKLDDKICPIYRSYKIKYIYEPVLNVSVKGTVKLQPINKLIKYVFSKRYINYFNKFLENRINNDYEYIYKNGFMMFKLKYYFFISDIIFFDEDHYPIIDINFNYIINLLYNHEYDYITKQSLLRKLHFYYNLQLIN